jgi:hypothetical protein
MGEEELSGNVPNRDKQFANEGSVVSIEQRLEHLATILGTEEEKVERNEGTAAATSNRSVVTVNLH